jgi:hypothetical protein
MKELQKKSRRSGVIRNPDSLRQVQGFKHKRASMLKATVTRVTATAVPVSADMQSGHITVFPEPQL